jgi:hypothetical protein
MWTGKTGHVIGFRAVRSFAVRWKKPRVQRKGRFHQANGCRFLAEMERKGLR